MARPALEPGDTTIFSHRARRVDKNFTKFRRYDAFLNRWWHDTFMAVADRELTGHRWHPSLDPDDYQYVGRKRCLFAIEQDAHRGSAERPRMRLPAFRVGSQ